MTAEIPDTGLVKLEETLVKALRDYINVATSFYNLDPIGWYQIKWQFKNSDTDGLCATNLEITKMDKSKD